MVLLLRQAGADESIKDIHSKTARMYAEERHPAEVAAMFAPLAPTVVAAAAAATAGSYRCGSSSHRWW